MVCSVGLEMSEYILGIIIGIVLGMLLAGAMGMHGGRNSDGVFQISFGGCAEDKL